MEIDIHPRRPEDKSSREMVGEVIVGIGLTVFVVGSLALYSESQEEAEPLPTYYPSPTHIDR